VIARWGEGSVARGGRVIHKDLTSSLKPGI
jgi:hypothetical protein